MIRHPELYQTLERPDLFQLSLRSRSQKFTSLLLQLPGTASTTPNTSPGLRDEYHTSTRHRLCSWIFLPAPDFVKQAEQQAQRWELRKNGSQSLQNSIRFRLLALPCCEGFTWDAGRFPLSTS